MGSGFVVGAFGVLILAHAAYSTIQHRSLLKITEEEFSGPPMNVVIELLLGLVMCLWGALTVPGKFLSIHPDSEENSISIGQLRVHDLQSSRKSTSLANGPEVETLSSGSKNHAENFFGLGYMPRRPQHEKFLEHRVKAPDTPFKSGRVTWRRPD